VNFSIHLSDDLVERLNETAREVGRKRNALIRDAVAEYLQRHRSRKWPTEVLNFRGVAKLPRFEEHRKALKPPRPLF
jgi:metal-responsive CopG/Arc/MetJ family transcriptional regulator